MLGILAVPFLPRFLGPEAFGIVSFVLVIQSAVNLLDFGLSNSITRQVAAPSCCGRTGPLYRHDSHSRSCVLGYRRAYLRRADHRLLNSCGTSWLHPKALPPNSVQRSLFWASLAVASLWPMTFYSGALMGLERYTAANLVNAGSLTLRQLGGILVAWLTGGNLVAFFIWQFIASLLPGPGRGTAFVWRASGVRIASPVRWHLLREQKSLLSGMALSTGAMLVFTQLDKIVLSRLLPLSEFGLYSIAWTAAGIFYLFYSPVAAIGLPRFTTFLAKGDRKCVARSPTTWPHKLSALALFRRRRFSPSSPARSLRFGYTTKPWPTSTASLLEVLAPFAAVGALAYIPAVFQWAHGWTAPTSVTNRLPAWF